MPTFAYQGRSKDGKVVRGSMDGENQELVASALLAKGITPTGIKEAEKKEDSLEALQYRLGLLKIPTTELIMFSRQMTTLSKAGVPILAAITRLAETTRCRPFAKVLKNIVGQVASGKTLATAIQAHPRVFSTLYGSIIQVGENTGRLDLSFKQITEYLQLEDKTLKQIKSATRYPVFVLIAITVAIVVINIFVIPTFAKMFSQFKTELPLPTRILIATSNFMVNNSAQLIIGLVVAVIGARFWIKTTKGRHTWDHLKLRTPIIGDILNRIVLSRFTRSFAMIISSGVPVIKGVTLAAHAVGNAYVAQRILEMRDGIERGENLSQVAAASGLFTPLVLQMLQVGEDAGSIDEMLVEVAGYYESEVDYDLSKLGETIEPILLIVIAGMVLVLALGVFLPLWNMVSFAGR